MFSWSHYTHAREEKGNKHYWSIEHINLYFFQTIIIGQLYILYPAQYHNETKTYCLGDLIQVDAKNSKINPIHTPGTEHLSLQSNWRQRTPHHVQFHSLVPIWKTKVSCWFLAVRFNSIAMTANTIQASVFGVDTMMLWASGPTVEVCGGDSGSGLRRLHLQCSSISLEREILT
jgi:hypothetical protein